MGIKLKRALTLLSLMVGSSVFATPITWNYIDPSPKPVYQTNPYTGYHPPQSTVIYSTVGNTTHGTDGSSYTRVANTTYGVDADGNSYSCTDVASSRYCTSD